MTGDPPPTEAPMPSSQDASAHWPLEHDPPALNESEAMRRIQDLLTAKKLSSSDTVVFEYDHKSFTAQIMPDGSLKAKAQIHSIHDPNTSASVKLYSSPTEFASDMAARAAVVHERITRPRGKISINGWNNCTVKGRTLATIRNEMLHERKNEHANVSKPERVIDLDPASFKSGPSESALEESTVPLDFGVKHGSAGHRPIPHIPKMTAQSDAEDLKDPRKSSSEAQKFEIPTSGGAEATDEPKQSVVEGDRDPTRKADSEPIQDAARHSRQNSEQEMESIGFGAGNSGLKTQAATEQAGTGEREASPSYRKKNSEENSALKILADSTERQAGLVLDPNPGYSPDLSAREAENISADQPAIDGKQHRDTKKVEPAEQNHEAARNRSHQETPSQEAKHAEFDICVTGEEKWSADSKQHTKVAITAIPSPDSPSQGDKQENRHQGEKGNKGEQGVGLTDDNMYEITSLPDEQENPTDGNEDTAEMSGNDGKMEAGTNALTKPGKGNEHAQCDTRSMEPTPSQFRSLKGVADLQQEILGDSDSDNDSLVEEEKNAPAVSRKRSRSPSIHTNRKRKRTGDRGSPESERATLSETPSHEASRRGINRGPKMGGTVGSEIDGTRLDPETMEAAAIAAQIEKEEASNRARRTTRLAAGKIKQVDYKASATALAPRSVSPGHGSEENDRNSNENESPAETTRATRRRSVPSHLYPPQRSSRRVAKLRSGQEKDQSSNDEIENSAVRSSSGGNGSDSRADKENVAHAEDTDMVKGQGLPPNSARTDGSDRRRGRIDISMKRTRNTYHEEGDHDSLGRAYSTRASTRENSIVDAAEITDLGDPNDLLSESEDVEDEEDIGDRTEGHGFTISDLRHIADAVKTSGSIDPIDVLEALRRQDGWKVEDLRHKKIEPFLKNIIESIMDLSKSLNLTQEEVNVNSVNTDQVLSFLSAEVWRLTTGGLNTGLPRKPSAFVRRAAREDQMRSTLERSRRKEHRDVEELRSTLEREMESRRRAELDTLYVEIQVSEAIRALSREKARCCRVDQETEKYRRMEADARKRLERAKILVGQLRGEKDDSDDVNGNERKECHPEETVRIETRPNGSFTTGAVQVTRNSATSDDDVEMTDENITTTSRRLLEMDRLRVLIAAREAEAEEFQRICEKERMRFVSTLESKNRLETEIYLYRSHGSSTHGAGNASVLSTSSRPPKESGKKGDHRGLSAYGNRGTGHARQKGSVSKNTGLVPGPNQKNVASANKPKPGPGRGSEATKSAKRKPIAKTVGNGPDKV